MKSPHMTNKHRFKLKRGFQGIVGHHSPESPKLTIALFHFVLEL